VYIDIDRAYAINTLLKIYNEYKDNALIRETEHGYHVYIPIECTPHNFIFCFIKRLHLGDDRNRIAMDIIRLGFFEFENAFDVVFDEKIKNENGLTHKIKGKWYNLRDYLRLRGVI
jgi:hypothetical protein